MRGTLSDQSLIYLQIAQMISDDILREVYREDEQVPSTNELARGYNINPATAAKGLNLLTSDGILYKRRGLGMFVSPGAAEMIRRKRRSEFTGAYILPLIKEAKSLGMDGGELLELVRTAIEKGENKNG
ncbi:MAG: GntR family transcriptional regulator [Candidatus Heteroscillospira sp.]|jgi:GntR family transcriptional regulator